MDLHDIYWGILWLAAAACFTAFIVFFDRRKFATPGLGIVYILFFFIVGVTMLLASLQSLR